VNNPLLLPFNLQQLEEEEVEVGLIFLAVAHQALSITQVLIQVLGNYS